MRCMKCTETFSASGVRAIILIFSSTGDTEKKIYLLSIDKLHVLQILLLIFKCLYHSDLVPSIYSNYFLLNNEIHVYNYDTRLSKGLHMCGPRTSFWTKMYSV